MSSPGLSDMITSWLFSPVKSTLRNASLSFAWSFTAMTFASGMEHLRADVVFTSHARARRVRGLSGKGRHRRRANGHAVRPLMLDFRGTSVAWSRLVPAPGRSDRELGSMHLRKAGIAMLALVALLAQSTPARADAIH